VAVLNRGEGVLEVRPRIQDWWHEGGERVVRLPGSVERTAATWSSVLPRQVILAPGEARAFTLHLSPPEGLTGGYYAILFVTASSPSSGASGEVMGIAGEIGVPIQVRVGDGAVAIGIERISVDPPTETTPLRVRVEVRNEGDVHVKPEMTVTVVDEAGQLPARMTGEPSYLLPGETRGYSADWGGVIAPGEYQVLATLTPGGGTAVTAAAPLVVGAAPP